MADTELFDRLKRLNSAQFEEVIFRSEVNEGYLSEKSAGLVVRAIELARLCKAAPEIAEAVTTAIYKVSILPLQSTSTQPPSLSPLKQPEKASRQGPSAASGLFDQPGFWQSLPEPLGPLHQTRIESAGIHPLPRQYEPIQQ